MKRKFSPGARLLLWLVAWVAGCGVPAAPAHPAYFTAAQVSIEPDGHFHLLMQFDTLAFALNDTSARIGNPPMEALLAGPRTDLETALAGAKDRFRRGWTLATDHGAARLESLDFPDARAVLAWRDTRSPVLPVVLPVEATGSLPPGASFVTCRFPTVFDQVVLTVERPGEEPFTEPLEAGAPSTFLTVRISPPAAGMAVQHDPPRSMSGRVPSWVAVGRYVKMRFRHILPDGLDHILFVLGLFLLSPRLRPLLVQTTVFTVAHSITLGLSLYGAVRLPAPIVEPLIALSIVVVAVENLRTSELQAGRTAVIFCFGLMHGLGFASALITLGLPRREFLVALVGFNAGVELGQVAVVAAACLTIGLLRRWSRYRLAVVYPLSTGIALVALCWTAQRIFVLGNP